MPDGRPQCRDRHEAEEAMFILEGRGEFRIDGKTLTAGAGKVVFVPSESLHGISRVLEGPMRYVTIRTAA